MACIFFVSSSMVWSVEGTSEGSNGSSMRKVEDLLERHELSEQWCFALLVVIGCALMGLGYLMSVGAIRFVGRKLEKKDQKCFVDPLVDEVPVEDEADQGPVESTQDRWYRYKNDSLSECSDPDFWMEINHVSCSSSDSESEHPDEVTSIVHQAFDHCVETVVEGTLVRWLMKRCRQRRDESSDADKREVYDDHVTALSTSWMDMCVNNAVPKHRLRGMLKEFARMSPRSGSPTAALSRDDIVSELLVLQSELPGVGSAGHEGDSFGSMYLDEGVEPMEVEEMEHPY